MWLGMDQADILQLQCRVNNNPNVQIILTVDHNAGLHTDCIILDARISRVMRHLQDLVTWTKVVVEQSERPVP